MSAVVRRPVPNAGFPSPAIIIVKIRCQSSRYGGLNSTKRMTTGISHSVSGPVSSALEWKSQFRKRQRRNTRSRCATEFRKP
jgi:hypothetical protein